MIPKCHLSDFRQNSGIYRCHKLRVGPFLTSHEKLSVIISVFFSSFLLSYSFLYKIGNVPFSPKRLLFSQLQSVDLIH
jgi:hypothetical protein